MRAISSNATKGLLKMSRCTCTDNSGAKIIEVISVIGYKGTRRTSPKAGIADMVNVVVKKGKPEMRKKLSRAVVVRVKKEFRRANGLRVKFEDNAVVLVDDAGLPKASEIKGCVAKEVGERWVKIVGLAATVV